MRVQLQCFGLKVVLSGQNPDLSFPEKELHGFLPQTRTDGASKDNISDTV